LLFAHEAEVSLDARTHGSTVNVSYVPASRAPLPRGGGEC